MAKQEPLLMRQGGELCCLKTADEAQILLDEMAVNNYQWPNEQSILKKAIGIHDIDSLTAISASSSHFVQPNYGLDNQKGLSKHRVGGSSECFIFLYGEWRGTRAICEQLTLQLLREQSPYALSSHTL